ncbi:MAG: C4-dicarboxylate ABC transporter [Bacteroidota bacterium]
MKVSAYLGMFMGLFFAGMGFVLPVYPPASLKGSLSPNMFYVLGFLLVVYGIFRFYRAYNQLKRSD